MAAAFLMAARTLLGSSLFLLAWMCPHPSLDELQRPCPWRPEQLHGMPLIGGKATYLSDHISHELDVLGEAPAMVAVLSLLKFLVTLWPLTRPTARDAEPRPRGVQLTSTFLIFSHSNGFVVLSPCSFNLHFQGLMMLSIIHVFICHLFIFCGEVSFKFCDFFFCVCGHFSLLMSVLTFHY